MPYNPLSNIVFFLSILLIPPSQISKCPHLKLQDLSLMPVCVNAHVWRSINSSGDRPLMPPPLLNPNTEGGGQGVRLREREGERNWEFWLGLRIKFKFRFNLRISSWIFSYSESVIIKSVIINKFNLWNVLTCLNAGNGAKNKTKHMVNM